MCYLYTDINRWTNGLDHTHIHTLTHTHTHTERRTHKHTYISTHTYMTQQQCICVYVYMCVIIWHNQDGKSNKTDIYSSDYNE